MVTFNPLLMVFPKFLTPNVLAEQTKIKWLMLNQVRSLDILAPPVILVVLTYIIRSDQSQLIKHMQTSTTMPPMCQKLNVLLCVAVTTQQNKKSQQDKARA